MNEMRISGEAEGRVLGATLVFPVNTNLGDLLSFAKLHKLHQTFFPFSLDPSLSVLLTHHTFHDNL